MKNFISIITDLVEDIFFLYKVGYVRWVNYRCYILYVFGGFIPIYFINQSF